MEPTVKTLTGALPPYKDEWVLIHPNQQVHDIINEVLAAHKEFAGYYDQIALYFDADNVEEICDTLYSFCKKNLRYDEESEDEQSTALPTGLLMRGHCDCKGYAGFIGGVLDSIHRLTGKKIDWNYRFASYHALNPTPHHVFIVVNDDNEEMWIDPTPNSDKMEPVWQTNKKVSTMPLIRNIAGIDTGEEQVGNLADFGITAASTAANVILPGSGIVVTAVGDTLKKIFSHPHNAARDKIWFMYQIPKTNPTLAQIQNSLNIAKQRRSTVDAYLDSDTGNEWYGAYNDLMQSYQALINLLTTKQNLITHTGIGITNNSGGLINTSDIFVQYPNPVTSLTDIQAIAAAINSDIANLTAGTGTYTDASGMTQKVPTSNMPLIIGAVAGAATYFITKKKGKKPKVLLSVGVGIGGYFLYKQFVHPAVAPLPSTQITIPATLPQPTPTPQPSTGQSLLTTLTQGITNYLNQQQQPTDYSQGYAGMDYSQLTQAQDYSQLV